MQLYLYKINAPHNYVNKFSKDYQLIGILDGYLKQPTSILHPSILIDPTGDANRLVADDSNNDIVDDSNNDITFISDDVSLYYANYVYIPDFNRYYYINDIIVVTNALIQINTDVDVLMSFKDDILTLDAFIGRNEYNYDDTLVDDKLNYHNYYNVVEYDNVGVNDPSVNVVFDAAPTYLDDPYRYLFCYMLVGSDDNYSISGVQEAYGPLPSVKPKQYVSDTVYPVITNLDGITTIINYAQTDDTIRSYIYACVAYPFPIPTNAPRADEMYFSFGSPEKTITIEKGKVIMDPKYLVLSTFNASDYIDLDYISSISKYELYVPFGGYIQLNYSQIVNKRLSIAYSIINYTTGEGSWYVLNMTDNIVIANGPCMLGIKMPLSTTNAMEVSDNEQNIMSSLALKTIATTVGAVLGVVGGYMTGGPTGALMAYGSVVGGTASLATAGGTALAQLNTNYDRAQVDNIASNGGLYNALTPKLRITRPVPKSNDANYKKFYGKPTKATHRLSDLRGFTIVDDIQLTNIENAFDNELNDIKALLMNGVIL